MVHRFQCVAIHWLCMGFIGIGSTGCRISETFGREAYLIRYSVAALGNREPIFANPFEMGVPVRRYVSRLSQRSHSM
ncbi:hypothetical protein BCR43DRAFT_481495 [Syncephalastrum racemosum]|uniref:Secreted protein n=1 Tax=Syncephalastrum racemosum TaxID=13706 RepID=A0A1X2HS28_SYNRA|nr:hypothetical protein BCR43DRAFT_481495 [Syncephalastrum racemosum]